MLVESIVLSLLTKQKKMHWRIYEKNEGTISSAEAQKKIGEKTTPVENLEVNLIVNYKTNQKKWFNHYE